MPAVFPLYMLFSSFSVSFYFFFIKFQFLQANQVLCFCHFDFSFIYMTICIFIFICYYNLSAQYEQKNFSLPFSISKLAPQSGHFTELNCNAINFNPSNFYTYYFTDSLRSLISFNHSPLYLKYLGPCTDHLELSNIFAKPERE